MRRFFLLAAFFLFFAPAPLLAASAGDLVKTAENPAVYYFGSDGKRYVFPNSAAYFSWYDDFSGVKTISPDELAAMPIGGNVTYRPGTRMVKIQTDPKVYAVSKGGVLRHVGSEAIATCLFGANWNVQIDDVSDAFFVDYDLGPQITACADYDTGAERNAVPTIGADKSMEEILAAPLPTTPTFSVMAGAASPVAGQEGTLMELRLRTAAAVRIRHLPVRLDAMFGAPTTGQGADSDLGGLVRGANERLNVTELRWVDANGNSVFGTLSPVLDSLLDQRQTLEFGGTWEVPTDSDLKLRLVARFDSALPSGEEYGASLPVSQIVVEDASGNSRSFLPALDLVAPVAAVGKGTFEISANPIPEKDTQVRGSTDVALAAFTFRAGSIAETHVRSLVFQSYVDEQEGHVGFRAGTDADNGTETRASDLVSTVRLVDDQGRVIAGSVPMPLSGRPAFSGLDLVLSAGTSKKFVLRGDLRVTAEIETYDDRLAFDVDDVARDVATFDSSGAALPAAGITPNGGTFPRYALTIRKHGGLAFVWNGAAGAVVAGRESPVGTLKISAAHDAFSISSMTFSALGDSHTPLTGLRVSYKDANGSARSDSASFSGTDAAFTGLALRVPRDGDVTLSVYGQLAATSDGTLSGKSLRIAFAADRPMVFASVSEGRTFSDDDIGNGSFTSSSAVSDLSVRLTELKAQRDPATPSGTIVRGQAVDILRFSLTAASEGAVRIKKLTFRLKPSDVGFLGSDNDALERWADVNGDAADDNGVIDLRRFLTSGSEVLGEDATSAIRYGIVRNGVADMTPQGLDSVYADEGHLEIEFADDSAPILAAGTTSIFALALKTDSFAILGGSSLEARLLGGQDFVWTDVPQGYYAPLYGFVVPGLPIVSPTLTLS